MAEVGERFRLADKPMDCLLSEGDSVGVEEVTGGAGPPAPEPVESTIAEVRIRTPL